MYTAPLYTKAEAARIVDVPTNTFLNWTDRYWYQSSRNQNEAGLISRPIFSYPTLRALDKRYREHHRNGTVSTRSTAKLSPLITPES